MHSDFEYMGENSKHHILIVDSDTRERFQRALPPPEGNMFLDTEAQRSLPPRVRAASCIALVSGTIMELPNWLHDCPNLRFLGIPVRLAESLVANALPRQLETIRFEGQCSSIIRLGVSHPRLVRIHSIEAPIDFGPNCFPSLRHCHIRLDKKKTLLDRLKADDKDLISMSVRPASTIDEILFLKEKGVRYLRLIYGRINSLEGIETFREITDLDLHDLPFLQSVEPLTRLKHLQDLSIGYCNRISDVERISEIKTLRNLQIYGCKWAFDEKLVSRLRNMKLKELML